MQGRAPVRLRLSHKGLMLVSGVLLFELVLVSIFAGLLGRSDQELDHSYIAISVINHVDKLSRLVSDAEIDSYLPANDLSFRRVTEAIPYELTALRLFLKGDDDCSNKLVQIEGAINREVERLRQLHSQSAGDPRTFDYASYRKTLEGVSSNLDWIAAHYRRPLEFVTDPATLTRRFAESNVIFVILINAIVAVATTLFFVQGIVNRLGVVADNSARFGRGEELNPPIDGTDEIAVLDRILHDTIRQRTIIEKLLKENEARTRSLIENMPVGVVAVSDEGIIESINPETEKIFGYSFDEVVGDHLMALFGDEVAVDRKAFTSMLYEKALGKPLKFSSRRKNGEVFPIEITLSQYDSVDGKRFLAIITDITEREKAEQFKQELIAMVSHDLRSPLTSVQGVMTLLARGMYGQLSDTGEKRVKVAEQSLSRLIHLVDDILDLERMEAGRLQFNREPVPVSSVIDRSIELVFDFAQQQQIRFDTPSTEIELFADEDRIVQVLVNLLSNAIKFSPRNSAITVQVADLSDAVEVSVVDQGAGIPAEHQERIFQRFQQVDGAVTSYKGTGLGLAICKAIVEGHEGIIGVSSEVGAGSRFWFRLPKQSREDISLVAAEGRKPSGVAHSG